MTAIEKGPSPLEQLRIATPCPARWEQMAGDDRVRFCQGCRKNVYNLSALPRSEAEALVARHAGKICALFYRRADGTVLTADCPVGRRKARSRLLRRFTTAMAALLGLFGGHYFTAKPRPHAIEVDQVPPSTRERAQPEWKRTLTPEEEDALRSMGYIGS